MLCFSVREIITIAESLIVGINMVGRESGKSGGKKRKLKFFSEKIYMLGRIMLTIFTRARQKILYMWPTIQLIRMLLAGVSTEYMESGQTNENIVTPWMNSMNNKIAIRKLIIFSLVAKKRANKCVLSFKWNAANF